MGLFPAMLLCSAIQNTQSLYMHAKYIDLSPFPVFINRLLVMWTSTVSGHLFRLVRPAWSMHNTDPG